MKLRDSLKSGFSVLALFLALASALSAPASPRVESVPLTQVRPTQMEIGKAMVVYSITKIRKSAPDVVDGIATRELPASIGPDGKYYIRDGHHWASAAHELRAEALKKGLTEEAAKMHLRLVIEGDFRGKSWPEFARSLYDRGVGYFTPAVRNQHPALWPVRPDAPGEELAEVYQQSLPATFAELKDSTGRSAFGLAIEKLGIVPEQSLQDYIEFYLAESFSGDLQRAGIALTDFSYPKMVPDSLAEQVQTVLVKSPSMVQFLFARLRPGIPPKAAENHLLKAINRFRVEKLKLPPLGPNGVPARI